jgi:cytoskeleton protein RodZ
MSDASPTLGDRLKAERERRELSPQKAADQLHLDAWVIDALEAEDYQRIGPSVYAKGHLKRYATLLGLSAPEFLAGYDARAVGPKPAAGQPGASVRLTADTAAVHNLPWVPILGCAAAVLLFLGILWWKPWHQRGTASSSRPRPAEILAANPDAALATTDAPAVADQPAASAPMTGPTPSTARAPASAAGTAAPLPAPATAAAAVVAADAAAGKGHARLRLSFSADSWVDVHDAAGRVAFSGNGRANSVKTIAGAAPLRVYLRSVSGVQLEINNRAVAIGPQFVSGEAARFEAGADGVLRRDSHPMTIPAASMPAAANPAAAAPAVQSRNSRPPG